MQIAVRKPAEGVVLLELKGSVDAAVQDELSEALTKAITEAEKGVLISLDGVDFIDSSGIGTLMRAWGEAENQGLRFGVVIRQPRLRRLLDTLGLLETLPNFLTVGDALNEWKTAEEREKWEVQPITPQPAVGERPPSPLSLPQSVSRWGMTLQLACEPEMIAVARMACAAFASQLGFSLDDLEDIKLAVSEACTNVLQHAYEDRSGKQFTIVCWVEKEALMIEVRDQGRGLRKDATFNFGLRIIHAVMDKVEFSSEEGRGTIVRMVKQRRV